MARTTSFSVPSVRHVDWQAYLTLTKPITWFPPMWAFGCGLVSSGLPIADRWPFVLAAVALAGPLVCGTSQIVNDWFDREVDAINEPDRPIPSGRVPGNNAFYFAIAWSVLSLVVASFLGKWVMIAAAFGLVLAWAYSAPPVRLKNNGWFGNSAVGLCYEGLPWFTAVVAVTNGLPSNNIMLVALLYSIGAHGIMTLNDFKAIAGDRLMDIKSLPVQLGVDTAAKTVCATMLGAQLIVVGLLVHWQTPIYAALVLMLVITQAVLMRRFLKNPRRFATWFSGFGVTLYVLGMLATAFALRSITL